jgi:hypothetical protein
MGGFMGGFTFPGATFAETFSSRWYAFVISDYSVTITTTDQATFYAFVSIRQLASSC